MTSPVKRGETGSNVQCRSEVRPRWVRETARGNVRSVWNGQDAGTGTADDDGRQG